MGDEPTRASIIRRLDVLAEELTAHQLDLVAQMENQLRAVHHAMRRISTLRSSKHRVGEPLSNGERREALSGLAIELFGINAQIDVQSDTCRTMDGIVRRMRESAADLRLVAERLKQESESATEESGTNEASQ